MIPGRDFLYRYDPKRVIIIMLFLFAAVAVAALTANIRSDFALIFSLGAAMLILAFIHTEWAFYLLIFSMLLSPEVQIGGFSEMGVASGRALVLRLDDLMLVLVVFGWFVKSAIYKHIGLVAKTPLNKAIYYYVIVYTISTGVGILYGDVSTLGVFNILKFTQYFILFFIVVNNLDNEKQARRLVIVALITAVIIIFYSLSQIPTGHRISAPFEGERGEPNTLSGYLVLMNAIILGIFLETDNFYKRIGIGVLAALSFVALMYTESRSGYIGIAMSTLVLIFYTKRRNLIIAGAAIALIFSAVLLPDRVKSRITSTFQAEQEQDQFSLIEPAEHFDSSTEARIQSWAEGYQGWKKYPLLGWGVTGFKFIDAQYIKVLAETGAAGALTFLFLLFTIGRHARNVIKFTTEEKNKFWRGISIGYYAGFIGLCGHAIGTNTFIIIRIMEPFWLMSGIVISIPRLLTMEEKPKDEEFDGMLLMGSGGARASRYK